MSLSQYYQVEAGEISAVDPGNFSVHDKIEEFLKGPRVFTTFVVPYPASAIDPEKLLQLKFLHAHILRLVENARTLDVLNVSQCEHQRSWIAKKVAALISEFATTCTPTDQIRARLVLEAKKLHIFFDTYSSPTMVREGAKLSSFLGLRPWPNLKTTATEVCLSAQEKAVEEGCDEALLIDEDGGILEAAWSNVFWIDRQQRLHTPVENCLPGIARSFVLDHTECQLGTSTVLELLRGAEEIFLTKSTSGVVPVTHIDGFPIGTGEPGKQTMYLQAEFAAWIREHK